jgi:hypothetical protein
MELCWKDMLTAGLRGSCCLQVLDSLEGEVHVVGGRDSQSRSCQEGEGPSEGEIPVR